MPFESEFDINGANDDFCCTLYLTDEEAHPSNKEACN